MKRFVTYANFEEKLIWGEFVVLSFQSLEDWFCVEKETPTTTFCMKNYKDIYILLIYLLHQESNQLCLPKCLFFNSVDEGNANII